MQWVALFHCKDNDSAKTVFNENDVLNHEERIELMEFSKNTKYSEIIIKILQPAGFTFEVMHIITDVLFSSVLLVIFFTSFFLFKVIQEMKKIAYDLIDKLLSENDDNDNDCEQHRERLAASVVWGHSKESLRRNISSEEIEKCLMLKLNAWIRGLHI